MPAPESPPAPADAAAVVRELLEAFYAENSQIKESHGLKHVLRVHGHARLALEALSPPLPADTAAEIEVAALLHDVDDRKYFPENGESKRNARALCDQAGLARESTERIIAMIGWVGCSENGNSVPAAVASSQAYHLLIPRWADRLEAVGAIGVVRCYQYNRESGSPLSTPASPRPTSEDEVFRHATPDRFEKYISSGGQSTDMISHYYDKLLHIARPPAAIVQNAYLEKSAEESSKELVEVCVRFGKTGEVDEGYITDLERQLCGGAR